MGVDAWRNWDVPHYITNNPVLAHTYAEIIFGFFRDHARLEEQSTEYIYILELGSGSGRLAYHLLRCLSELVEHSSFKVPKFRYILSDYSESNIRFWINHPRLQVFVEQGMLDFAYFDAVSNEEIHLIHADILLTKGSLVHPIIVIANYFLDVIPQDLYYFKEQVAWECYVSLQSNDPSIGISPDLNQLELILHNIKYDQDRYEEVAFNSQLDAYRELLQESYVFFPLIGLRCLERVRELSEGGIMLLCADKGNHLIADIDHKPAPHLFIHGNSFSLNVNYHAISNYYTSIGGVLLASSFSSRHIAVLGILLVSNSLKYIETFNAFKKNVVEYGPNDFFSLKKHLEKYLVDMTLEQLISCFKLSRYDTRILTQCITRLLELLPDSSEDEKKNMRMILHHIWEGYYPIGEEEDLAFHIGLLYYQLQDYDHAIVFFVHSLRDYGDEAPTYYNMALCFNYKLDVNKALDCLEACLSLQPDHQEAKHFQTNLLKKRSDQR